MWYAKTHYAEELIASQDIAKVQELVDELLKLRREHEALKAASEPFAKMGDVLLNSPSIDPDYGRSDKEIYSLDGVVLQQRDFVRVYKAVRGVI